MSRNYNAKTRQKNWKERKEYVVKMRKLGYTFQEIADELDCSRQRVHQLFNETEG